MRFGLLCATALVALACCPSAVASEVSLTGGVLIFMGDDGSQDVEIYEDSGTWTIYDWAGDVEPGPGCMTGPPDVLIGVPPGVIETYMCRGDARAARATLGGMGDFFAVQSPVAVEVDAGEGDDFVGVLAPTVRAQGAGGSDALICEGTAVLDGGPGDDHLLPFAGDDVLTGGPGADTLVAGPERTDAEPQEPARRAERRPIAARILEARQAPAGEGGDRDTVDGGAGRDDLLGGRGADALTGGAGRDRVRYDRSAPVVVDLAAGSGGEPGEGDVLSGIESVLVARGDDTIRGTPGVNDISTGRGNDEIDPGTGFDSVDAGEGDDAINARDGLTDDITCGDGADRVTADTEDEVDESCDVVERAVVRAPDAPIQPVRLAVKGSATPRGVRLTGRLELPPGTRRAWCRGGGVSARVSGLGGSTRRTGTVLDGNCRFAMWLPGAPRGRVVRWTVAFAGTPRLAAVPPTRGRTRVRR